MALRSYIKMTFKELSEKYLKYNVLPSTSHRWLRKLTKDELTQVITSTSHRWLKNNPWKTLT